MYPPSRIVHILAYTWGKGAEPEAGLLVAPAVFDASLCAIPAEMSKPMPTAETITAGKIKLCRSRVSSKNAIPSMVVITPQRERESGLWSAITQVTEELLPAFAFNEGRKSDLGRPEFIEQLSTKLGLCKELGLPPPDSEPHEKHNRRKKADGDQDWDQHRQRPRQAAGVVQCLPGDLKLLIRTQSTALGRLQQERQWICRERHCHVWNHVIHLTFTFTSYNALVAPGVNRSGPFN